MCRGRFELRQRNSNSCELTLDRLHMGIWRRCLVKLLCQRTQDLIRTHYPQCGQRVIVFKYVHRLTELGFSNPIEILRSKLSQACVESAKTSNRIHKASTYRSELF